MTVLQRLEELAGMEIPTGSPANVVAHIVRARLDAASDVAWLRPALFPEDDDG